MTSSKNEMTVTCGVCDSDAVDVSATNFDGICTNCGFVIHDSDDTSAPDWLVVKGTEPQDSSDDWMANCRVQNATEKRLAEAFDELEKIAGRMSLPLEVRSDASDIYCEAFLAGITDGRDTRTMIAACARLASLECNNPVPSGRLTETSEINSTNFHSHCSILRQELKTTDHSLEPVEYLTFLDGELEISASKLQATTELLENITGSPSLVGKDPSGIASAGLYYVGNDFTQSDVAEAVGVSTETVRKRISQIEELDTDV